MFTGGGTGEPKVRYFSTRVKHAITGHDVDDIVFLYLPIIVMFSPLPKVKKS